MTEPNDSMTEQPRPTRPTRPTAANDDDDDNVLTRGGMAVKTFLDGMESAGELLPGAREILWKRFGPGSEDGGLRPLVNFLADPGEATRYGNPERPPSMVAPFRALCRRFGGVLHKGEPDSIYDDMAIHVDPHEFQTDPGKVAAKVWEALHNRPEYRQKWHEKYRPPLGYRQAKALAAIEVHAHHLHSLVNLEELAEKWRDLGAMEPNEAVRVVAKRLGMEHNGHLTRDGRPVKIKPAEYVRETPRQVQDALRQEFLKAGNYEVL